MKRKLFSSVLVSALAVTSLTACGGDKTQETATEGDTTSEVAESDVEVDIFQFKVEFKDQFEDLADAYEEETGVKINVTTVGGGDDYGAALKSKVASGDEPNIFNIGGMQDVNTWQDRLYDLSGTELADAAIEGTLDSVTNENGTFGVPYNQEGYGFIYNKAVFEQAGIDPASLTDWDTFVAAVETLDSQKEELGIDAVFAMPGKETWVTGLHLSNIYASQDFANVPEAYNATEIPFTFSEEFKQMVDLQNEYSIQPVNSLDYSQQVEQNFSMGKVAMIQQGNWVYGSIAGIDEEFAENNIGMIPMPIPGVETSMPVGVPMYWGVNSTAPQEEIDASIDFLTWMYTSEVGKEYCVDFGFIPAYEGFDADALTDPLARDIYTWSAEGKTSPWVFMGYPDDWGMGTVGANIQKYVAGEMTWEELIADSQAKWAEARSAQ